MYGMSHFQRDVVLKTHHRQLIASKTMRGMLDGIRVNLREALKAQKDEMGYNLAALKIIGTAVKEKSVKDYVDEETWDEDGAPAVLIASLTIILVEAVRRRLPRDVAAARDRLKQTDLQFREVIVPGPFGEVRADELDLTH